VAPPLLADPQVSEFERVDRAWTSEKADFVEREGAAASRFHKQAVIAFGTGTDSVKMRQVMSSRICYTFAQKDSLVPGAFEMLRQLMRNIPYSYPPLKRNPGARRIYSVFVYVWFPISKSKNCRSQSFLMVRYRRASFAMRFSLMPLVEYCKSQFSFPLAALI